MMRARAVAAVVLLLALACGGSDADFPEELRGRWESDHRDYRGRFLTLTPDTVCFGASEAIITPFPIDEVACERDEAELAVVIIYRESSGATGRFSVHYELRDRSLHLAARPGVVWFKKADGDAARTTHASSSRGD